VIDVLVWNGRLADPAPARRRPLTPGPAPSSGAIEARSGGRHPRSPRQELPAAVEVLGRAHGRGVRHRADGEDRWSEGGS
jgi:hypothetical protein